MNIKNTPQIFNAEQIHAINLIRTALSKPHVFVSAEANDIGESILKIEIIDDFGNSLIDKFVKPYRQFKKNSYITRYVTKEDLIGAKNWKDVRDDVYNALWGKVAICYNDNFIIDCLRYTNNRYNKISFPIETFCLMHAYAKFFQFQGHWREGYQFIKLNDAASYVGHTIDNRHRVRAIYEVANYIAALDTSNS